MAVIVASFVGLALLIGIGLALFSRQIARKVEAALPPLGRFFEFGEARIHYLDEGTGPAIVLVHGLGGQMRHFTALGQALRRRGLRTIAIDRPGSGHSSRFQTAAPSAQARAVAELIRHLGLERPLVVGHSLGGAVALALALDFPETAGGLVLLAPLTQPQAEVPALFRGLAIRSLLMRRLIAWTLAVPLGIRQGPAALKTVFAPEPVPADFAVAGGGLLSLRPKAFIAASADLVAAQDAMELQAVRYPTLDLPVGVLFGTEDRILDCARHALTLRDQIADVELELIEGAGHMLPLTRVDAAVAFIERTLARVEPGASGRVGATP